MAEAETKPDQVVTPTSTKRERVPFEIPVLPLQNTTLFPETMVPLAVGRPASMAAVEVASPVKRNSWPASVSVPRKPLRATPLRKIYMR
jgi:ATP-dependent Lon protease